jgi:catechol 2,3-dioxygenase-like lactoylglutathione lyase family enzyme
MLHHVELYVRSLSDARKFWGWLLEELGYSLYQDWAHGFSYKMDNTYLVFVQTEDRFLDIPYHRCRPGLNHLAFWAKSREEVDIFTEKLKLQNITILYKDKHPYAGGPSHYAVYFEDPDRMKVEIVAPS